MQINIFKKRRQDYVDKRQNTKHLLTFRLRHIIKRIVQDLIKSDQDKFDLILTVAGVCVLETRLQAGAASWVR